jgi:hypothetical protein
VLVGWWRERGSKGILHIASLAAVHTADLGADLGRRGNRRSAGHGGGLLGNGENAGGEGEDGNGVLHCGDLVA